MRKFVIAILVCGIAMVASAKKPKTIDELKAQLASADKDKQPELYAKLAKMQLEAANDVYSTNVEQAKQLVIEAGDSAEKASQVSIETNKREKKTEIDLRKLGKRMEDVIRTWTFDDRSQVKSVLQRVETARSKLLDRMFEK
jgi:hypothetical protein